MLFRVTLLAADGRRMREVHDGEHADDIRERLIAAGQVVLSIRALRGWQTLEVGRPPRERQRVFCEQLLTLLQAGIPVAESLPALRDSERDPRFRAVLSALIVDIGNGLSLSAALDRHPDHFPKLLVSMLKAAERTGAIAEALQRHGHFQSQTEELRANLWAALSFAVALASLLITAASFLLPLMV